MITRNGHSLHFGEDWNYSFAFFLYDSRFYWRQHLNVIHFFYLIIHSGKINVTVKYESLLTEINLSFFYQKVSCTSELYILGFSLTLIVTLPCREWSFFNIFWWGRIIIIIILRIWEFFTLVLADSFPLESQSLQVSRTLLSILANPNNAVVWMVSTCPLISKSFSPCTNPLVTVLSMSVTIGITITFLFHSFFNSLARSRYLSLFLPSFNFTLWLAGMDKFPIWQVLFFCWLCNTNNSI